MEAWARWAHKALWHDFAPGWGLHKSHHELRVGPFEANDVFAIINAGPAFGLCLYGFLTPTLLGGLCFGAGEQPHPASDRAAAALLPSALASELSHRAMQHPYLQVLQSTLMCCRCSQRAGAAESSLNSLIFVIFSLYNN